MKEPIPELEYEYPINNYKLLDTVNRLVRRENERNADKQIYDIAMAEHAKMTEWKNERDCPVCHENREPNGQCRNCGFGTGFGSDCGVIGNDGKSQPERNEIRTHRPYCALDTNHFRESVCLSASEIAEDSTKAEHDVEHCAGNDPRYDCPMGVDCPCKCHKVTEHDFGDCGKPSFWGCSFACLCSCHKKPVDILTKHYLDVFSPSKQDTVQEIIEEIGRLPSSPFDYARIIRCNEIIEKVRSLTN